MVSPYVFSFFFFIDDVSHYFSASATINAQPRSFIPDTTDSFPPETIVNWELYVYFPTERSIDLTVYLGKWFTFWWDIKFRRMSGFGWFPIHRMLKSISFIGTWKNNSNKHFNL